MTDELIKKYDKPNFENKRENLRTLLLLKCIETKDGAFFRFSDYGQISCAIIAYSGEGAARLLKYLDENDKTVCIDLAKDECLPLGTIENIGKKVLMVLDCNAYNFLGKDIEAVMDEKIKEIDIEEARYIFENYEEKEVSSIEEIERDIKYRPAYGYYENGKLIGWVLTHPDGQIGALHVDKEHRKRGIAKKLMQAITKQAINEGRVPGCEVKKENEASTKVVTGVGFSHTGQEIWIIFE